jgi:hypothetical protein
MTHKRKLSIVGEEPMSEELQDSAAAGVRSNKIQKSEQLDSPPVEATAPAMAYHELANAFPLMEGVEFDALVADIKAHGLHNPITLFEDKILEGRNRDRACHIAGVNPRYVTLPADCSPVDFVISANLKRRHLTESQRGMIAVKLATMIKGGGGIQAETNRSRDPLVSQADAAKKLDVSVETVKRAKIVQAKGAPETIAAVVTGQLTVKPAAKIAQAPKEKQPDLVRAAGEKRPKTETQKKADKCFREQKEAAKKRATAEKEMATTLSVSTEPAPEHEFQSFVQALIEKFERSLPQLLTWLDSFSNTATAAAIRRKTLN